MLKRLVIKIDSLMDEQLRDLSNESGAPISEIVRRLMRAHLNAKGFHAKDSQSSDIGERATIGTTGGVHSETGG